MPAIWLALSTPALAKRQHVFASTFGTLGTGNGQFSEPKGVAINEASGDIYVVDSGNNRVERFASDGTFISQFTGPKANPLVAPTFIAVDNSTITGDPSAGDVYVLDAGHNTVDKFAPEGAFLGQVTKTPEGTFGALDGVAMDSTGTLWVYQESGHIDSYNNSLSNEFISDITSPFGTAPGFAVDSKDDLFVARGSEVIAELNSTGQAVIEELDGERATGVAVDLMANEVYVDNVTSTAVFTPNGRFVERFGAGELAAGSGVGVNSLTGTVYVADSGADRVDVFQLEPPSRPATRAVSATEVTATSTELNAEINPTGATTTYYFQFGTTSCVVNPGACSDRPVPPGSLGSEFEFDSVSLHLQGLVPGTTYHYDVVTSNEFGITVSADHTLTTQSPSSELLPDGRAWEIVSPVSKEAARLEAITREGGVIQAATSGEAIAYVANAPTELEANANHSFELTQVLSRRAASGWSTQDIATPQSEPSGIQPGHPAEYKFFSSTLSIGLIEQTGDNETLLAPNATERTPYLRDNGSGTYTPIVTSASGSGDVPPGTVFGNHVEFVGASTDMSHVVLSSQVPLTSTPVEQGGLYEWTQGVLQLVSVLPGTTMAAESPVLGARNFDVRHAISNDGTRVIWAGKAEEAGERVDHLYFRDVSRGETFEVDANQGGPPPGPERQVAQFQTADAAGGTIFFTSAERLTSDSTARNTFPAAADLYAYEVKSGKLTDLTVDHNSGESADVQGVVMGAAEDASSVYFVARGVPSETASSGGEKAVAGADNLYVERRNAGTWSISFIATLSSEDAPDWQAGGGSGLDLATVSSRVSPNGRYLAFMSNRSLTGYDNTDATSGTADEEVFLYDAETNRLVCASCNQSGARPRGIFDSGKFPGLLVDRVGAWTEHWLAASVPGWTSVDLQRALYQSRFLADDGRLFFNSPDDLVPQATSGKENVYEYQPEGVPRGKYICTSSSSHFVSAAHGCVALISSGTSTEESAFLDASERSGGSGEPAGDVFFLTAAPLVPEDVNGSFDVYDARECTEAAPCITPTATKVAPPCISSSTCRGTSTEQPPIFEAPPSVALMGNGNVVSPSATAPPSVVRRSATLRQKLVRTLKACRKRKSRRARLACEAQARKMYRTRAARNKTAHTHRNRRRI
jgi:NHL repeat